MRWAYRAYLCESRTSIWGKRGYPFIHPWLFTHLFQLQEYQPFIESESENTELSRMACRPWHQRRFDIWHWSTSSQEAYTLSIWMVYTTQCTMLQELYIISSPMKTSKQVRDTIPPNIQKWKWHFTLHRYLITRKLSNNIYIAWLSNHNWRSLSSISTAYIMPSRCFNPYLHCINVNVW